MKNSWLCLFKRARLCLALFIFGCDTPVYRLDGQVPGDVENVQLLDSTAVALLDSLRGAYGREAEGLRRNARAALDSLSAGAASLNRPLKLARQRYQTTGRRYREAFAGMQQFTSFGGNRIFSETDLAVSTSQLLREISDRFYDGKAFSLETEAEARRYIREKLVPLEREVNRARNQVARFRKSQSGSVEAQKRAEEDFSRRREALLEQWNQHILDTFEGRVLAQAHVDSTRRFLFAQLPAGRYHLYVPQPLPEAWLIPVVLRSHLQQNLGNGNLRPLLFSAPE